MAAGGWSLADELVMYQGKIFMPTSSQWWPIVLAEAHGMGHEGAEKTLCRLRASFYTPVVVQLVKEFIQGCEVCQKKIKPSICIQLVFFNHCLFLHRFGPILQWIL
jgi:hypothetical protein